MELYSSVTAPLRFLDIFLPWTLPGLGGCLHGGSQGKRCGHATADLRDKSSMPDQEDRSQVSCSFLAASRTSNAKAMEKVAPSPNCVSIWRLWNEFPHFLPEGGLWILRPTPVGF